MEHVPTPTLFPSDTFMLSHFGPDCPTSVTLRKTGKPLMLYSCIRRELDGCVRSHTMRMMRRIIDEKGGAFQGVYVVKYGRLRPWIETSLYRAGFDFSHEAKIQLAQQLLDYYRNAPFYHDDWWIWHLTENSLGAKLAPHANPQGGNRPKRTLSELFGDSK